MPENTLALFGALQLFFNDIAQRGIPAHVAAFILKHIREHNAVPLEDVPLKDWLSIDPKDTLELYLEFSLFCQSIYDNQVNALEATEQIESVHLHIEDARKKIMSASLEELGFENSQRDFLNSLDITNLNSLINLGAENLIRLKGDHSYDFISRVLERARTIPLVPTFAA